MTVVQVYDNGQVFSPSVLDISEQQLVDIFIGGGKTIAALSLALNFPTLPSVMHSLVNAYKKNILPVSLATDYTFWGSEKTKEILENPEAFASAAAAAAPAAAAAAPAAEAPKEEEKEESDDDMVRRHPPYSFKLMLTLCTGLRSLRLSARSMCLIRDFPVHTYSRPLRGTSSKMKIVIPDVILPRLLSAILIVISLQSFEV